MIEYCSFYLPKHIPVLCRFNKAPVLVIVWKITLFQMEGNYGIGLKLSFCKIADLKMLVKVFIIAFLVFHWHAVCWNIILHVHQKYVFISKQNYPSF